MTSAPAEVIFQRLRRQGATDVSSRSLDQAKPVLLQPAHDHRPVALSAVLVHGMKAFDGVSVIPAHDPGSAGRSIQSPAHGADARGADIEPSDQARLSFARGAVSVRLDVHDMDLGFGS
jgi:hypothetical protein